jgi:hypothetical protein
MLDELESRRRDVCEVGAISRDEVVHANDVIAFVQKVIGQMRSDESCGACD